jgi:hypothetical protein
MCIYGPRKEEEKLESLLMHIDKLQKHNALINNLKNVSEAFVFAETNLLAAVVTIFVRNPNQKNTCHQSRSYCADGEGEGASRLNSIIYQLHQEISELGHPAREKM